MTSMNMYYIYWNGGHVETIYAYCKEGALIHFNEDYPEYEGNVEIFEMDK